MQRKAAIYIRTSSEPQGEKASPSERENDYLLSGHLKCACNLT